MPCLRMQAGGLLCHRQARRLDGFKQYAVFRGVADVDPSGLNRDRAVGQRRRVGRGVDASR